MALTDRRFGGPLPHQQSNQAQTDCDAECCGISSKHFHNKVISEIIATGIYSQFPEDIPLIAVHYLCVASAVRHPLLPSRFDLHVSFEPQ